MIVPFPVGGRWRLELNVNDACHEPVVEGIHPAVDPEFLAPRPGILHDGGLAHVGYLLDHVEFAQAGVAQRLQLDRGQQGRMLVRNVTDMPMYLRARAGISSRESAVEQGLLVGRIIGIDYGLVIPDETKTLAGLRGGEPITNEDLVLLERAVDGLDDVLDHRRLLLNSGVASCAVTTGLALCGFRYRFLSLDSGDLVSNLLVELLFGQIGVRQFLAAFAVHQPAHRAAQEDWRRR